MVRKHGWCPDCGEHISIEIRIGADGDPYWACPHCGVVHITRSWYKYVTEEEMFEIINHRGPRGLFVHEDATCYIGIDNRDGDAWVEEFPDLDSCLRWLADEEE